jgi:hypothetical protein
MADFASSRERSLEKNAEKLQRKARERIEAFTEGLGKITSFNTERIEDADPNALLRQYRGSAHSGLKAILARAAAQEAAAKAGGKLDE